MTGAVQGADVALLARIDGNLQRLVQVLAEIRDRLPEAPAPISAERSWLTTREVTGLTGLSSKALRNLRRDHAELEALSPSRKSGAALRWHRDAVGWLRQRGLI